MLLTVPVAAAVACGDSDSAPDEPTAPRTSATIAVLESPTAESCDRAGVPGPSAVGQERTVRGTVAGTSIAEDDRGRSVILELGEEGGAPFAVAIPESETANFPEPPQNMYEGKQICVHGTVIDHRGVPTIFVSTPAEISARERIDD